MSGKLLVIQVAALGYDFFVDSCGKDEWEGLTFHPTESIFPAVTCTVQASMRTAQTPAEHGMVFNGYYNQVLRRPSFWEQSSRLVQGPRIWDNFRQKGGRVGMFFWQQSMGESLDMLLSPAPIHPHGGGMIQAVYSKPGALYDNIKNDIGKNFKLSNYWGPFSSLASTRWITGAALNVMDMGADAPEVLFVYLPHLDYSLQKHGPESSKAGKAFGDLTSQLKTLKDKAEMEGYELLIFGDYAMAETTGVILPNLYLAKAGLLKLRSIKGMLYPDYTDSQAFAVTDHEIAHVYLNDSRSMDKTVEVLKAAPGEFEILTGAGLTEHGIDHANSGDIVLKGKNGNWFSYGWWESKSQAPDYATHIDIHNKPGFDPCELFTGWHPFVIDINPDRVKGTHGCAGDSRRVAWTGTLGIDPKQNNLVDLSKELEKAINNL